MRIAGVYAMAALADQTSNSIQRQQCIDALCAYLRLPYHASQSDGLLSSATTRRTATLADGEIREDQRTYTTQPQEREVRLSIISVIRDHLQHRTPVSWEGYSFDFSGTVFDGGDFIGAQFSGGKVSFDEAAFAGGNVSFKGAKFTGGEVSFNGAAFAGGNVSFKEAKFTGGEVTFNGTAFAGGNVSFDEARFTGARASFTKARFTGGYVS